MKINFNEDFKTIYDYLEKRVLEFDAESNVGPKPQTKNVSMIQVGYQIDQAGWLAVIFDMREMGEPDGEWTTKIKQNSLEMPHWFDAINGMYEGAEALEVVLLGGASLTLNKNSEPLEFACFGETVKAALMKARKEKLFEKLPLAKRCILGIEEFMGHWGWPKYEEKETVGSVYAA